MTNVNIKIYKTIILPVLLKKGTDWGVQKLGNENIQTYKEESNRKLKKTE